MTVTELYEWATENNVQDYEIITKVSTGERSLTGPAYAGVEVDHEHHYVEL